MFCPISLYTYAGDFDCLNTFAALSTKYSVEYAYPCIADPIDTHTTLYCVWVVDVLLERKARKSTMMA